MDKPEKRIDLNSELGMTRRDLIRRGAIVGGTLLWVAPAIQSMAPKAFAQEAAPGSVLCRACRTDIVRPRRSGLTTAHYRAHRVRGNDSVLQLPQDSPLSEFLCEQRFLPRAFRPARSPRRLPP